MELPFQIEAQNGALSFVTSSQKKEIQEKITLHKKTMSSKTSSIVDIQKAGKRTQLGWDWKMRETSHRLKAEQRQEKREDSRGSPGGK